MPELYQRMLVIGWRSDAREVHALLLPMRLPHLLCFSVASPSIMSFDGAIAEGEEHLEALEEDAELATVDATHILDAALKQQQARNDAAQQQAKAKAEQPQPEGRAERPMPIAASAAAAATFAVGSTAHLAASPASPMPSSDGTADGAFDPVTATHAPDPSLFSLLGVLNSFRARVSCRTLHHLFDKINVDPRTWQLLLRSQLPCNDAQAGMEQLRDTLTEFVRRLNRKSSVCLPTILDNAFYSEEVNFAYRVYSRAHSLQAGLFRSLKPLFAEVAEYLESERGSGGAGMPMLDFKALYPRMKQEIDRIFKQIEAPLAEEYASANSSRRESRRDSNSSGFNGVTPAGTGAGAAGEQRSGLPEASPARRSMGALAGFVTRTRGASRRGSCKPSIDLSASATAAAAAAASAHSRRSSSNVMTMLNMEARLDAVADNASSGARSSSSLSALPSVVFPSHLDASKAEGVTPPSASPPPTTIDDAGDNEDSEEENETESATILGAADLFSKLLHASHTTHCFPLPPRARPSASSSSASASVSPPLPTLDLLRSYLLSHCRSFRLLETIFDAYFSTLLAQIVALAVSEIIQKKELYAQLQVEVNHLASHFVRLGLPLMARLLAVDASFLSQNLLTLSFAGLSSGRVYSDARQVVRKARLLHGVFSALDIFVFPRTIKAHHRQGCKAIAHAQTDNMFVASAGYDRAVRLWDLRVAPAAAAAAAVTGGGNGNGAHGGAGGVNGGAKCLAQFIGHTSVVTWVSFASADEMVVSGSLDGTVRVWNARSGACVRVLQGHSDGILCGELGSKDKYVATGSMDCSVRLWSMASGKCLRVYRGHRHWVKTVRFDPDAQWLLSAGMDHAIFVWHLRGGAGGGGGGGDGGGASAAGAAAANPNALGAPRHVLLSHTAPVMDVRMLSASRFVSASKDLSLRVWDAKLGKQIASLSNPAHSTPVAMAVSPDLALLAVAFGDHTINVYQVDSAHSANATAAAAGGGTATTPTGAATGAGEDEYKLRRQIKVHNDGIICVSFCSRTTLLLGTPTGNMQVLQI